MFDHFIEIPEDLEFGLDLLSPGTEVEFLVGQFIELAGIPITIKRYCGLNILEFKHALAADLDYILHERRDAGKAAQVWLTMLLEQVYLLCELLVQYSEIEKLNIGQLQQSNGLLELA